MRPLIQVLGYESSGNFIPAEKAAVFGELPFSHLCRRGLLKLGLQGVYVLRNGTSQAPVPAVAVCKVDSEEEARRVHKLVWNQDYVPFVLVESPKCVRLYSGFNYQDHGQGEETGLIAPLRDFNRISEFLDGFKASQIDDGTLWSRWGHHVDPSKRVDWRLLESLGKLAGKLKELHLPKPIRHAFIGRYAYLRYLLDRGFLSPRKLARWGLEKDDVFSPNATLKAFLKLNECLDDETDGLNGSVFPFDLSAIRKPHLEIVARAFAGHDVESGQDVFDFMSYDFSYIPIETLSVIYEQFLHEPEDSAEPKGRGKAKSKGRSEGAYYTPIPLVNFMIAEMDARKNLDPGMKVLDPSCGSGAFLVQTYRMLIERAIRDSGKDSISPPEMRQILTKQIYGVDRDADACRIAEMSLLVTLLDYVNPPDLEGRYKGFLLPTLAGINIFEADFFDSTGRWAEFLESRNGKIAFDWVIGNPPWKEIKNPPKDKRDKLALDWMRSKDSPPTGGNQLAEAFVWKCQPLMNEGAVASMVLPAMTLFKNESKRFRQRLFATTDVWCVVNFANLAYVLFSGRTNVPAMSIFFQKTPAGISGRQPVTTFAPMVVNQEANRPQESGAQLDTWNVVMNASEIRQVSHINAVHGDGIIWKVAMWGTFRDSKLIARLGKRWKTFGEFADTHGIVAAQSTALRTLPAGAKPPSDWEYHPEIEGGWEVLVTRIGKLHEWLLAFPERALSEIPNSRCWVRKRSGLRGLTVSYPPHVVLDATRRFAVFSNEFILIPPKKIGISMEASPQAERFLRACSLFLLSDFAKYFEFFHSTEWGVQESLSTLAAMRGLPVPFLGPDCPAVNALANIHQGLCEIGEARETVSDDDRKHINNIVFRLMELSDSERYLIEDFVRVHFLMIQCKVEKDAVRAPKDPEVASYLKTLRDQLDDYMEDEAEPASHHITAVVDRRTAMIEIVLRAGKPVAPVLKQADEAEAAELTKTRARLLKKHRQWIYFNRSLKLYSKGRVYLFKPLQRVQWTRRQAILDADELIAEVLASPNA